MIKEKEIIFALPNREEWSSLQERFTLNEAGNSELKIRFDLN